MYIMYTYILNIYIRIYVFKISNSQYQGENYEVNFIFNTKVFSFLFEQSVI